MGLAATAGTAFSLNNYNNSLIIILLILLSSLHYSSLKEMVNISLPSQYKFYYL